MCRTFLTFQQILYFEKALYVGSFEDALILADLIQLPMRWRQFARACITCLEFDLGRLL